MKKFIVLAMALVFVLGFASLSFGAILNSKHDLTTATGTSGLNYTNTNQPCAFCHHPHRGAFTGVDDTNAGNELLWNMGGMTDQTTRYDSDSMDGETTTISSTGNAPQSYLCMACHDGAISTTAIITETGDWTGTTTIFKTLGATANLGDLANDHPVNMTYDDGNDLTLKLKTNVVAAGYPLYGDTMQCASCHDVHAGGNSQDANTQFLRGNTAQSAICIACHNK